MFGDAICSFNPIYGQGMSVAALQGLALEEAMARGPDRLAWRFFKRAARALEAPWAIAVGGDLWYPSVTGPRTPLVRFINWYLGSSTSPCVAIPAWRSRSKGWRNCS